MKKLFALMAAVCCMTVAFAQAPQIVTGHPDFKVKVTRCEASGKNVVLDLTFTNVSAQDVEKWDIYAPSYYSTTTVYDSEGNIYNQENQIQVKVSNGEYRNRYDDLKMISDVPMKVSVMIVGVPTNVESLARVDIHVNVPLFNIDGLKAPIKIKNIPIAR